MGLKVALVKCVTIQLKAIQKNVFLLSHTAGNANLDAFSACDMLQYYKILIIDFNIIISAVLLNFVVNN
jgi:hypothetical protein